MSSSAVHACRHRFGKNYCTFTKTFNAMAVAKVLTLWGVDMSDICRRTFSYARRTLTSPDKSNSEQTFDGRSPWRHILCRRRYTSVEKSACARSDFLASLGLWFVTGKICFRAHIGVFSPFHSVNPNHVYHRYPVLFSPVGYPFQILSRICFCILLF